MTIGKRRDIRRKVKEAAIGAVALLAMTGPMLSTAAAQTDEVLQGVGVVQVDTCFTFNAFGLSFVDPTLGRYLVGDRCVAGGRLTFSRPAPSRRLLHS